MLPAGEPNSPQPAFVRGLYGYEIERVFCQQPHALIYHGRRKADGLAVLIKLLRNPGAFESGSDWLERDYRIVQQLGPDCAARPLAFEQTDHGPALIYPDEGAQPLAAMAANGPIDVDTVLTVGAAIAEALSCLHRARIVHCNLNPATVWIREDGAGALISDFGCGRNLSDARASGSPSHDDLLDLRYMSPEQSGRLESIVDQRADIYALGIILFRLLAGEVPFDDPDPVHIIDGHVARQPAFPAELLGTLPSPLVKVVLKALAKPPEHRYLSANGLVADLLECRARQRSGTLTDFEPGRYDAKAMLRVSRRLYGRERETAALLDKAKSLRDGKPALLFVKGPPGVGKSTLLGQLEMLVRKEDGRFVSGKFDQYKRNVPYLALVQALQQLIGQLLSETKDQLEAWRARILGAVGNNAKVVIDVIPELELITGPGQPAPPDLPPIQARNRFNHVFTRLIQVLAERGEPLCLVMDDLQWVDAASLVLLSHVLTDHDTRNILFVGAYRDNEVEPGHPLDTTIRTLRDSNVDVTVLPVGELSEADILQLARDTFGVTAAEAGGLAQVLHAKSGGNALYLSQFIPYLCDEGLIAFDYREGKWVWDLPRIQQEGLTHDVLELLRLRLNALHEDTRTILATAACIGSTFEAAKVAAAAQLSITDVAQCLTIAAREGLIVATEDSLLQPSPAGPPEPRFTTQLRFVHDRVQEAAFDTVPEAVRKDFRLQIGRRLLAGLVHDDEHAPPPYVLGNLNFAWDLIAGDEEKRRVAHLNLSAGRRARQALAYQDALGYVSVGLGLLGQRPWEADHDLAFELNSEGFECEFLSANFERADLLFQALIANARTKLEKARIYRTKIVLDTSAERYEQAITMGIEALKVLDIPYMRRPSHLHLLVQFMLVWLRMPGSRPQDLIVRDLGDPEKIAALNVLVELIVPAYYLSRDLWMLTTFKIVNLSLRHGISPAAAMGFLSYGAFLGAVLNDYKRCYEFGRFSLELAERGKDPSLLCRVLFTFTSFVKASRDPRDECFPLWDRVLQLGLETGEHRYVNFTIDSALIIRCVRGSSLQEVLRLYDEHLPFVLQSKQPFSFDFITICRNFALALQGKTPVPYSLSDDSYDEVEAELRYRGGGNLFIIFYQCFLRLELACLFGRFEEALILSDKTEAVAHAVVGSSEVPHHYFYRGLAAAVALGRPGGESRMHRRTLQRCMGRLRVFAANSPHNFRPLEALLEAEAVRLNGQPANVLKRYNHAIDVAEEEGYTHLAGLASERAALFCLADGQRRFASWYLAGARAAYGKWGATAKVEHLDREYTDLLAATARPAVGHATDASMPSADRRPLTHPGTGFDIAAALNASRIIAGGETTEGVLTHLIQVMRVQAGAETAHLLVLEGGTLRHEASATVEGGGVLLFPSAPAEADGPGVFSPAVVNYVLHTGEELVLTDAGAEGRFARCNYVASRRPKSVLCSPIRHQREMLGVVYLEHARIAGAFDGQKLEWIRLLATEVGLAVWSARLSRYRDYVHKFAPAAVAKEIDANPASPNLEARDCDVSILFGDLAGYTRIAEQMDRRELDEFMNRVLSRFIDEIHRHEGTLLEIRGDELFVLFGDDDHSRHVWKAAQAALAISRAAATLQEELSGSHPPIILNMGINSGVASVGLKAVEASSGSRWRYGASGTVVNVAARVRELARDGNILLSADAAARVADDFVLEDTGEHALKNVMKPIRIYRLLGERGQQLR